MPALQDQTKVGRALPDALFGFVWLCLMVLADNARPTRSNEGWLDLSAALLAIADVIGGQQDQTKVGRALSDV